MSINCILMHKFIHSIVIAIKQGHIKRETLQTINALCFDNYKKIVIPPKMKMENAI